MEEVGRIKRNTGSNKDVIKEKEDKGKEVNRRHTSRDTKEGLGGQKDKYRARRRKNKPTSDPLMTQSFWVDAVQQLRRVKRCSLLSALRVSAEPPAAHPVPHTG